MATEKISRGRPRKSPEGDRSKEEARQKGRLAQNRLKKRRQAKIALLEGQIGLLQRTVEGMSNEFLSFTDSIVSSAQLIEQPGILDNLKQTTVRFLDLAVAADVPSDEHNSLHPLLSPSVTMSKDFSQIRDAHVRHSSESYRSVSAPIMWSPVPFNFKTLFAASMPNSMRCPTRKEGNIVASTYLSPVLGINHENSLVKPATTTSRSPWQQYLIAGPNSFAMRLYIEAITLVLRVIRGEIVRPGFIPSVARHYLRHERPDSMADLIRLQLEKMSVMDERSDNAIQKYRSIAEDLGDAPFDPVDYESINHILARITADVYQEDQYLIDWLDPWSTQQYLAKNWNMELTATSIRVCPRVAEVLSSFNNSTENTIAHNNSILLADTETSRYHTSSSNESHIVNDKPVSWGGNTLFGEHSSGMSRDATPLVSPEVEIIESDVHVDPHALIHELLPDSVCFGEGPRFSKDKIDKAAAAFLRKSLGTNKTKHNTPFAT